MPIVITKLNNLMQASLSISNDAFIISFDTLSSPGALPFFNFFITVINSFLFVLLISLAESESFSFF